MNEWIHLPGPTDLGSWKADIKMMVVTIARWVPGTFYIHFCTLGFIWLDRALAGRYHLPAPQHLPCLADPSLHTPRTRTHSPSSACSPSGRYINKQREKVTQLAGTELSLTRVQMKCAEVGELLHQAQSTCELFLIPTRPSRAQRICVGAGQAWRQRREPLTSSPARSLTGRLPC